MIENHGPNVAALYIMIAIAIFIPISVSFSVGYILGKYRERRRNKKTS